MYTLILFTRKRFPENVKKNFLKIEYPESLLELVRKKICRTVFSRNDVMLSISLQEAFLSVFGNAAGFSKNQRCRIFTRNTCSKENLM